MRLRDERGDRGSLAIMLWGAGMLALGCSFDGEQTDAAEASAGETESGATESGDDPGSSEAGGSSESSDEGSSGGPEPSDCTEADEVDASFTVDDHDWPGGEAFQIDFDVACEIVEIGEDISEAIETTLECDLDGTPQTVTITMAYASPQTPEGVGLAPTFGVGQAVRFRHVGVQNAGGLLVESGGTARSHLLLEQFSVHAEDGKLLMAGVNDWDLRPQMHAPVEITEEADYCGESQPFPDDPERPMLMRFSLDAASIEIVSGHSGLLDPVGDGEQGLAIAVELAQAGGCCHTDRQYRISFVDVAVSER